MNIKQLLILFSALFGIFIFVLMIKPSSGDIAPTTTESTTISISQGDYIISDEHDNIPNNYITVSGYGEQIEKMHQNQTFIYLVFE